MLSDFNIGPAIAVKDLAAAKAFYSDILGLKLEQEYPDGAGIRYKSGESTVMVYPSQFAGTNEATYAGWGVSDVAAVVAELEAKGVEFLDYPEMPGVTVEGHVHSWDGQGQTAWFKDPSGNILALDGMDEK